MNKTRFLLVAPEVALYEQHRCTREFKVRFAKRARDCRKKAKEFTQLHKNLSKSAAPQHIKQANLTRYQEEIDNNELGFRGWTDTLKAMRYEATAEEGVYVIRLSTEMLKAIKGFCSEDEFEVLDFLMKAIGDRIINRSMGKTQ